MSPGISTRLLATQSDERLLALVREGHERAFEALVQRYRRPLLNYCRRLPIPEARVEDVLQQALLKTWIALRGGADVRDIKAWLYRVVHNTAVNAVRDAAHDGERLADPTLRAGVGQADLERGLVVRETLAEVAALPLLQREVIVRTAVGGYSHEQVASDLGITDGAVRGLLYRARATLRTAVTALTPPPLLTWLLGAADKSGPAPERLGELAAGGGAAGFGGLLVKGGVLAVTAGTLITGAAVVHIQGSAHHRAPAKVAAVPRAGAGEVSSGSTAVVSLPAGTHPDRGRAGRTRPGGQAHARGGRLAGSSSGAAPAMHGGAGSAPRSGRLRAVAPVAGPTTPSLPSSSGSTEGTTESAGSPPGGGSGPAEADAGQGGASGAPGGSPVGSAAGSGSGPEGSSGGDSGGAAPAPSGGEASGGSDPSGGSEGEGGESGGAGGSGSSGSAQTGGVVGTVVHEVGNLLEHLLH